MRACVCVIYHVQPSLLKCTTQWRIEKIIIILYTVTVTGIVHGERILATNQDGRAVELVTGLTRYILVVAKAPSGCRQCTVIPTSGNMFLMGRIVHSESGAPFLHVDQRSFGFAYRLTSEGRDEVCSLCPAASAVSTSARCPVSDKGLDGNARI